MQVPSLEGPDGIEASSLGLCLPSVLWRCWLGTVFWLV